MIIASSVLAAHAEASKYCAYHVRPRHFLFFMQPEAHHAHHRTQEPVCGENHTNAFCVTPALPSTSIGHCQWLHKKTSRPL